MKSPAKKPSVKKTSGKKAVRKTKAKKSKRYDLFHYRFGNYGLVHFVDMHSDIHLILETGSRWGPPQPNFSSAENPRYMPRINAQTEVTEQPNISK